MSKSSSSAGTTRHAQQQQRTAAANDSVPAVSSIDDEEGDDDIGEIPSVPSRSSQVSRQSRSSSVSSGRPQPSGAKSSADEASSQASHPSTAPQQQQQAPPQQQQQRHHHHHQPQPPPRRLLNSSNASSASNTPASSTATSSRMHGMAYIGPSSSNVSTSNMSSNTSLSGLGGGGGSASGYAPAQSQPAALPQHLAAQQQQPHAQHQQYPHVVSMESPLPPVVQRSLGDRSTEKRKNAALEIEALIKSLMEANNLGMIQSVITVLSKDFCTSMNSNYRKGGLVGLAATAIGLLHHSRSFLNVLLPPVLHCFDDPESRVRYYACESLYNIAKVSRQAVLDRYFSHIWEGLTKLFADVDVDVKNGANLLDRLIKDICTEADQFRVADQFLPLLQTYIRRTNPYIRQLIVGWITFLDSIPDVNMLDYLPDFLDGLFNMLSDTNREIRQAADSALAEFLRELAVCTVVELGPVVTILVAQICAPSSNTNKDAATAASSTASSVAGSTVATGATATTPQQPRLARLTAITWLAEIIHHPYSGGDAILPYHAPILGAILFCLSDPEAEIRHVAERTHFVMLGIVRHTAADFALPPLLTVLTTDILRAHEDVPTKLACLQWINMLMEKRHADMNAYTEQLLPVLLRTLSDPADAVVLLDLQALSRISVSKPSTKSPPEGEEADIDDDDGSDGGGAAPREEIQFQLVLNAILNLFAQDRQLLETRGSLIIRKLCVLLNAKSVYIRMADTLASYGEPQPIRRQTTTDDDDDDDNAADPEEEEHEMRYRVPEMNTIQFISTMVQTLNIILLTASELHELRSTLALSFHQESEEGRKVFVTLFHCWCHNPVSTFALCLLARAYDLSFALVKRFSEMATTTVISVGFLMQLDKLVQLLESPIFLHLRLQLLHVESPHHAALLKSIYGLLLCLPQGDAFRLLNDRLTTVCHLRDNLLHAGPGTTQSALLLHNGNSGSGAGNNKGSSSDDVSIVGKTGLSLERLLERFDDVMKQHEEAKLEAQRTEALQDPYGGGGGGSQEALLRLSRSEESPRQAAPPPPPHHHTLIPRPMQQQQQQQPPQQQQPHHLDASSSRSPRNSGGLHGPYGSARRSLQ